MKYIGIAVIVVMFLIVVLVGFGVVQSMSQANWEQNQALINADFRPKPTHTKLQLRKLLDYARHPDNKGEFSSWKQDENGVKFEMKQLYAAADRKFDSLEYLYHAHDSGDGQLYFEITVHRWDSKLKKTTMCMIFDENADGKVDNLADGQDAGKLQKEFNQALTFLPKP